MFGNSLTDTTRALHDAASPFGGFPILPPSPTGTVLADVDADEAPPSIPLALGPTNTDGSPWPHEAELPPALTGATVPTNTSKERTSPGTLRTQYGGASLLQYQKAQHVVVTCLDEILQNQGTANKTLVMKVMNTQAQLETLKCIDTHETRKRKTARVSTDRDAHKDPENEYHSSLNTPATIKRICREKTGTDWQSVFDVVKYGEERQSRQNEAPAVEGK